MTEVIGVNVFSRLFGGERVSVLDADDRTLSRYRYLLETAPVESLEQAHAEAFRALAEPHRAALYGELSRGSGTGERPLSSEPDTLARSATRAERRVPGTLERVLRDADDQHGFDGSLISPVVSHVTTSPLVSAFLPWNG
jgi:hypothetical protein